VKQRNAFMVGATALIAIVLTVAAALWLGHVHLGRRPDRVEVRFRTVGGLNAGAPVTLRGVKIGQVFSVELADGNWVVATLKLEARAELPANPAVIAATSSLFGEWEAQIVSLDDPIDQPAVKAELMAAKAAGGGDWPGATLPDIGQLTAQAGRIAGDIALLTDRVGAVFDSTTAARVRSSLEEFLVSVNKVTAFTNQQTVKVDKVTTQAVAGSTDLAAAAKDLRAAMARVDSATSEGQIASIVNSAQGSSTDLRAATADLRTLLTAAREHEVNLVRVLVAADSIMGRLQAGQGTLGMLTKDSTLYLETTATMIELRKLIADIQVNPRKYFKFSVF
jgi:phospholipid/cholesterol/gamma-HCH transport system substrate-binding protein